MRKIAAKIRRIFRARSSARIFAFYDGSQWRSIDPVEVVHALAAHPKYVATRHPKEVNAGDPEAIAITAAAVSDVFKVEPYNGDTRRGLTVAERIALLDAFDSYCYWVKKNINPTVTQPPSTESTLTESGEPTTSGI